MNTGMQRWWLLIVSVSFLACGVKAEPVDVMSFNIRYGTAKDGDNQWKHRKDQVIKMIAAHDPDLLGTQEVLDFQRDFLQEKLPGYACVSAGRDDGKEQGEMTAIYFRTARFALLDSGHFWLSPTPDKVASRGWDAAITRVVSWVKLKDKLDDNAKPIVFMNAHFDHRGHEARFQSAQLMVERMKAWGPACRMVVAGDFNEGEGSRPYKALFDPEASGLIDTYRFFQPQRSPDEGTFTGFKSAEGRARIDWIACSDHFGVSDAKIVRDKIDGRLPSDHYPVTARLVSLSE
jgi:endonuclease/exonuclease/phosphatase family metal-dependent hydrolase